MILPLVQLPELSPNLQALSLVNDIISRSAQLQVAVAGCAGATVIDCGVRTEGGYEAGVLFSRICLGGLADVRLSWQDLEGIRWPCIEVTTDHPIRACMASQYAGWPIKVDGKVYMGSGPACAVVCRGSLFQLLGYRDPSETVILCMESTRLPSEDVIRHVAEACCCETRHLYILVAPTASLTGTVQVAARALETGLFKLRRLGYDLGRIVSGTGLCPVSPVAANTKSALGRTNDAISYGSTILLSVRDDDAPIRDVIGRVPSCAAPEYGRAYNEIEKSHDNFFNLSPDQFNPAVAVMCSLKSGNAFTAGELRPDILRRSFGLTAL